ncbi:signal peptide peptidase SppA [Enterobacterales bacterium endosymbiont of Anomoneura mori]|uniref:signal peptide peptidase SppA n=1 Tax=Enterobacterales bacterium endosymbiont of Anomoneura mori TaxID=3132096 RepID=UPI00399D248D
MKIIKNLISIYKKIINYLFKLIKKIIIIFIFLKIIFYVFNYLIIYKNKIILNYNVKKVLLFDIKGIISDEKNTNNIKEKINYNLFKFKNTLFDIIKIIRSAKKNKNITGIILKLNKFLGANQTSLKYIGKVLNEFKKSGKPIFAISDNYNKSQYYLASFANYIYIYPNGILNLYELNNDKIYYKSLLNKLKINCHIYRIGIEKTAIEPYIYDKMPKKTKHLENKLLNKLWLNYIYDISKNRKIKLYENPKNILKFIKFTLKKKNNNKYNFNRILIDKIITKKQIKKEFIDFFGLNKYKNNYKFISFYNYKIKNINTNINKNEIAIIFINGKIINSKNIYQVSSSKKIINKLKKAKLNNNIKAIILFINSPGGSIEASEKISSEILNIRKLGKPVIALMGNICASGGYWISTAANYIIADSNTITGSIGVFTIINTYEKFLNSFGIHYDSSNESPLSNLNFVKPLSKYLSKLIELNVKNGYIKFIKLICKRRNIDVKKIIQLSQGNIFLGEEAKKNKLIDQIGDFDDAIKKIIELSKLKYWHLNWII